MRFFLIGGLQPLPYFSCLVDMLVRIMYTKRIILLIIGIFVAIAICLSTSLFGMHITHILPSDANVTPLKAHFDFVLVINGYIDWNTVIAKF